jgi:hypothetical protein
VLTGKRLQTFPKSVVLLDSKDGESTFLRNIDNYYRHGRNVTEDLNLHQHRCENLRFRAQNILQRVVGISLGHSSTLNGLVFNQECVF